MDEDDSSLDGAFMGALEGLIFGDSLSDVVTSSIIGGVIDELDIFD